MRYVPKELLQPAGIPIPDAPVLDLILYSREQIAEEYKSMGRQNTESLLPDSDWSIISVKPQAESFETPMQPITMCFSLPLPVLLLFLMFCFIQDAQQPGHGRGRKRCFVVSRKVCAECGFLECECFDSLINDKKSLKNSTNERAAH